MDVKEIKQRLISEHMWLEGTAVNYIEMALEKYSGNEVEYTKYLGNFIKIITDLIKPHHKFEEDEVFPLFKDDRELSKVISKLIEEHRMIEDILNNIPSKKSLDEINKLLKLIKEHVATENMYIIPALDKL